MFLHRLAHDTQRRTIFHWFLLAMSAGSVNAGGFLATGRFVSHVTGFATLFGTEAERGHWEGAIGILTVPVYFVIGAFLAGWWIDRRIIQKKPPHFDWVMGLSAAALVTAAFLPPLQSALSGGMPRLGVAYTLLVLLCLSSGLQNAALTTSSGSSVRTTHLTGLTTDLGLGLARILFHSRMQSGAPSGELRTLKIRLGIVLSFVAGSAIGAWLFSVYGNTSFLFAALVSLYAAIEGRRAKRHVHRSEALLP